MLYLIDDKRNSHILYPAANNANDIAQKSAVTQFPAVFMRERNDSLIGQAAHGRMAGINLLTAWPIRESFLSPMKTAGN